MHPQLSSWVEIVDIPNAGRGVIAADAIPSGTVVHVSDAPAVHVIFREYRKEVCAYCFHYDRGRTLPVRDESTRKVFCSDVCHSNWTDDLGDLGLASWRALESFVNAVKSKTNGAMSDIPMPKPGVAEIDATWRRAETSLSNGLETTKNLKGNGKAGPHKWSQVDPDVLSYLLSGILFHYRFPERWNNEILVLAMDEEPYRNGLELEAFCEGYKQLASILPSELNPSVTSTVCRTVVSAAGHNAFGIRPKGDADEYMGYAIYPSASYFNHSCRPNIAKERIGRVWKFQTSENIAEAGEQCCISYLGGDEVEMTVRERRNRLQEVWGFSCACQRCLHEANG